MTSEWYIHVGDTEHGPMSLHALKQLAQQGTIVGITPVRKGVSGEWVPAERVRGLLLSYDGPRHFLVYVVAPTAIGAAIYIFFRSPNLLVFRWLDAVSLRDVVMAWRTGVASIPLPDWLLYSVPDGLWVFATTSWIIHIWRGHPPWPWLLSGVVLGIGSEFGQALGIVPGTYQHADVMCYTAGFFLALIRLR